MTQSEATDLLRHHSLNHDDLHHPKSEKGFLGMLRPFTGQLYEHNYQEVMEIIRTLSDSLGSDTLEKETISNLWAICHYSRLWAAESDGMLRRNHLLSDEQVRLLNTWINNISEAVMNLLEGNTDSIDVDE